MNIIRKSAMMQLEHVNSLLDIIKMETGNIKLNYASRNIAEIINTAIKINEIIARKKRINIKAALNCEINAEIDSAKITQVINNLLSNAIKFSHRGSKIIVECHTNGDEIEIHVIDNGIGFDMKQEDKIFRKFREFRTHGTDGETGSGLGLTICKKFVELHGGRIGVYSKPGKGSDFYFTIPINTRVKNR
jgi:signal transduction histidine kinase